MMMMDKDDYESHNYTSLNPFSPAAIYLAVEMDWPLSIGGGGGRVDALSLYIARA